MTERRTWLERAAEWLIARLARDEDSWWLIGDLREGFRARRAVNAWAATRWYIQQVTATLGHQAVRRRSPTSPNRYNGPMLPDVKRDIAYALRVIRRTPIVSLAIVLTIGLSIGVTTSIFTIVNSVLLRPLPFAGADRTLRLSAAYKKNESPTLAFPDLMDLREGMRDVGRVAAVASTVMTATGVGEPEALTLLRADDEFRLIFGLAPVRGRWFSDTEQTGSEPAIVLSHAYWQRAFGGEASVIGRSLTLDGVPHTIVGVLPAHAYLYPDASAAGVIPLRVREGTMFMNRGAFWINGIAQLHPGVSMRSASARIDQIMQRLGAQFPQSNAEVTGAIHPLQETIVGPVAPMLVLLSLSVAAVLFIAGLNVANLMLSRAHARSREFAVRAALGGSTRRLRQQVACEGLVLAAIGGSAGLLIAPLLTDALLASYPGGLPRASEVDVDYRVLLLSAAASLIAGVVSLIPLGRRVAPKRLQSSLLDGGRGSSSARSARFGNSLIALQVAMSVVLLFGSVLLTTTLKRLTTVDLGFDARGSISFRVSPPPSRYPGAAELARYYASLEDAIRRIPGVTAVSSTTQIPLTEGSFGDVFARTDLGDQGANNPNSFVAAVGPDFHRALGIPLIRGRSVGPADDSTASRVVVVNTALAEGVWPGEDPIGKRIDWNRETWTVVGIVGSAKSSQVSAPPLRMLYTPAAQRFARTRFLMVRSTTKSTDLAAPIRAAVLAVDRSMAITDFSTFDERARAALAGQRFRALLVAGLGVLAIVLAAIGIYGVVSYHVSQRSREIGIRLALGDTQTGLRRRLVSRALRVGGTGALLGIIASLWVGRWLTQFLYNTQGDYPAALLFSPALLLTVVGLAAYVPARRASDSEPSIVLRAD